MRVHPGEIRQYVGQIGMIGAVRFLRYLQGAQQERFGLCVCPLGLIEVSQVHHCVGDFGMGGSQCGFFDRDRAFVVLLGLGVLAQGNVGICYVFDRERHVGMVFSLGFTHYSDGALIHGQRLGVVAGFVIDEREIRNTPSHTVAEWTLGFLV